MTTYLTITPHDPLIARDGRPFSVGVRMKSLDWPHPTVIAGSIRTILGKTRTQTFDRNTFNPAAVEYLKKIEVLGPLPMVEGKLCFPTPRDLLVRENGNDYETYAIRPAEFRKSEGCDLPLANLLPAMLPTRAEEDFKPAEVANLWPLDCIVNWLTNPDGIGFDAPLLKNEKEEEKEEQEASHKSPSKPIGFGYPPPESRVHVAIDPFLGAAQDGMLFETVGLDFAMKGKKDGMKISVRISGMEKLSDSPDFFPCGGERRLSFWEETSSGPAGWDCPSEIKDALRSTKKVRMVLATPAFFTNGWLPGTIDKKTLEWEVPGGGGLRLRLVSACIERWKPLSGWNMERNSTYTARQPDNTARQVPKPLGPKPLRRLVPAGSVYFFEVTNNTSGEGLAKLWLQPVTDESEDGREKNDGFGLALWGVWDKHAEKTMNEQQKEV